MMVGKTFSFPFEADQLFQGRPVRCFRVVFHFWRLTEKNWFIQPPKPEISITSPKKLTTMDTWKCGKSWKKEICFLKSSFFSGPCFIRGVLIFFWGKESSTNDFNHLILIPYLRSLMKDAKFLPAMIMSTSRNYVGCNVVMFSSWRFQPTQLKNIRQIGHISPFGVKICFCLKPPPSFNQFFLD